VSELTILAASVILTLLANLRQCFMSDQSTEFAGEDLDEAASEEGSNFGQKKGSRTLFASSLQVVLKGLIDHILQTSKSTFNISFSCHDPVWQPGGDDSVHY
jgi:nuclear pore complex protein Nup205